MIVDFRPQQSLADAMDGDTQSLLRALCTRIGIIMEDEASTALIWNTDDPLTPADRLIRLQEAGSAISRLAAAGLTLLAR